MLQNVDFNNPSKKTHQNKLDPEEKEILASFERGEWKHGPF